MIVGIDHITIAVKDLGKSEEFFKKLGFEVYSRQKPPHGQGDIVRVRSGNVNIDLHTLDVHPGSKGHIAFLVDDMDKTYEEMKKKDVKFSGRPPTMSHSGRRMVQIEKDPDGNEWHLASQ
jgi:catechol 2,3-dioxygenase-like lactoylglutathione lyase family enzyme